MVTMAEIKSFLGTMGLTLRKLLWGENVIADYEDIQSRRMICYSCEFLTGKTKKTFSCLSCNCNISLKIMFTTAECPEGKWKTMDY
jgi:hypothetical protein